MKHRNKPDSNQAVSRKRTPITPHQSLVTLALVLACAGCKTTIGPAIVEGNYLSYDIPFTDAAAQAALQDAVKICAERKQNAIMTSNPCTLTKCFTNYQCVPKDGSTGYVK